MNAFYNPKAKRVVMVHSKGKALDTWRDNITSVAKTVEVDYDTTDRKIPISIGLRFGLKQSKSNKDPYPVIRPDLDKLIRAVLDALTGVLFVDDSQVVHIDAQKTFSDDEGVIISISAGLFFQ